MIFSGFSMLGASKRNPKQVTEKIPPSLLRNFRAGNCVAFVGAGFSVPVKMPLWKDLLTDLVSTLEPIATDERRQSLLNYATECIEGNELARAASAIRAAGKPGNDIDERVRDLFKLSKHTSLATTDHSRIEMESRLQALVSLPWAGVVTTNYDELLEHSGKNWNPLVRAPKDRLDLGRALKSTDRPFLVHLHGTVTRGGTIVLTEEDYDAVYLGSSTVDSFLRALMLRYTLVFIGTSVEDRFVDFKRDLQSIFREPGQTSLLDPEFVLLANDDGHKGDYLERTEGFRSVYYDNSQGRHEGFVDALRRIRDQLVEPSQSPEVDDVATNLLAILQESATSLNVQGVADEYDKRSRARGDGFSYGYERHGAVTVREIHYRLMFLRDRHYLNYSDDSREYAAKTPKESLIPGPSKGSPLSTPPDATSGPSRRSERRKSGRANNSKA